MPNLRQRLTSLERLTGVFLKTPAPHLVELSALAGCDFVSPDMEHAPLDVPQVDLMMGFAGRSGVPLLPRLPSHDAATIGRLLDLGAAGVLAPHVSSADSAKAIVAAARLELGARGFSPSPRAGNYGALGVAGHLETQTRETVVALQIEDSEGLAAVAQIAAVPGVDALFVGPVDLARSLGVAADAPELNSATAHILAVGQAAGLACGIFVPDGAGAVRRAAEGFTWFIVGSDQSHYQTRLRAELERARRNSKEEINRAQH